MDFRENSAGSPYGVSIDGVGYGGQAIGIIRMYGGVSVTVVVQTRYIEEEVPVDGNSRNELHAGLLLLRYAPSRDAMPCLFDCE